MVVYLLARGICGFGDFFNSDNRCPPFIDFIDVKMCWYPFGKDVMPHNLDIIVEQHSSQDGRHNKT